MSAYPVRLIKSGLAVAEAARLMNNMICHAGTLHKHHPLIVKLSALAGEHEWQDYLWREEQEKKARAKKRKKKKTKRRGDLYEH
jgi:uncharacterized protein (DUF2235 family)